MFIILNIEVRLVFFMIDLFAFNQPNVVDKVHINVLYDS